MFRKKSKLPKYRYSYGKSPLYTKKLPKKYGKKLLKKSHPFLNRVKKLTILCLFGFAIILVIYLIFFSQYFLIERISISDENIDNQGLGEEVKAKIADQIGQNLLFINPTDLDLKIKEAFPELEQVTTSKNYPNEIVIEFSEYPLVANVISESKNIKKSYIINSIGYAIKENLENTSLPYIRIKSEEPVNTENPVIEGTKLQYILETVSYFEDKFGMRVVEVDYRKIPREIHLLTEKDFYIWIDIQRPYEEQLKKLKKAIVKLDIYNDPLAYIDLRIAGGSGDKIIYKRK